MDRYSVGSTLTKSKVQVVYQPTELIKKEDKPAVVSKPVTKEESKEKEVSLKEIDDKFMTIDDFLDNFD